MTRRSALVVLAVLLALAAFACGRKAKPEPLWGASRVSTIIDPAR